MILKLHPAAPTLVEHNKQLVPYDSRDFPKQISRIFGQILEKDLKNSVLSNWSLTKLVELQILSWALVHWVKFACY